MKYILLLISLLSITSCAVQKENSKKFCKEIAYIAKKDSLFTKQEVKQMKKYCRKGNENEKYTKDQVEKFENYFNEFAGQKQTDSLIEVFHSEKSISIEDNKNIILVRELFIKNKNITIVDKTKVKDIKDPNPEKTIEDNSSKGTIAYSVPKQMQVGKSYQIKLRITKQKGKEINKTLILGEREILISDSSIDSKVTIENIRVEKTMTAQLISEDEAFKITKLNTDKQIIENESYTEWGWIITPLKSGKTYLKLIIKIKIQSDGETTFKDIVVFDKDIKVKANVKYEVKGWFEKYWQWLMSTIIIPIVIYFYKKREKRKELN